MNDARCKKQIYNNFRSYQCSRKKWKDGFCKQHHPESVEARRKESDRKYEKRYQLSAYGRLEIACKRIKELEAEIERLNRCLEHRN